jgi:hypothetical protein
MARQIGVLVAVVALSACSRAESTTARAPEAAAPWVDEAHALAQELEVFAATCDPAQPVPEPRGEETSEHAIFDELRAGLASVKVIHHFGPTRGETCRVACGEGHYVCGAEAERELRWAIAAKRYPIWISTHSVPTVLGIFTDYYRINDDGEVTHYHAARRDGSPALRRDTRIDEDPSRITDDLMHP